MLFLGTLTQFLLAPVLWVFWLVPLGVVLPGTGTVWPVVVAVFLLTEAVNLAVSLRGLRRSGQRLSPLWALVQHVYFPLATVAAIKALWELAARPFFWDKTSHGHFDAAPDEGGQTGAARRVAGDQPWAAATGPKFAAAPSWRARSDAARRCSGAAGTAPVFRRPPA